MTDNESYVIFRYDGDQYGKVSMYNSDWPQKINGEELESVLDGVMFARVKFYIKVTKIPYKALFC